MTESSGPGRPRRVAYVSERLASYRVPFLERLRDELAERAIELQVLYGTPSDQDASRDDGGYLAWARQTPIRHLRFGGAEAVWQPVLHATREADLIIVEQASRLLANYPLLARQWVGGPPIALFGHGVNLQANGRLPSRAGEFAKRRYSRLPHWWFAYTEGSARRVERLGFPPGRITVFQNAIDTSSLSSWHGAASPAEVRRVCQELGVTGQHPCLYVGSLYAHKRLDFLLAAGQRIAEAVPGFELLVVGSGPDRDMIVRAAHRLPWLHYAGPRFGREKAVLARGCRLMLLPGLVGLAVLDAFAFRLPLVTTAEALHSPEFEYLRNGANGAVVESGENPGIYASEVIRLLSDPRRLAGLRQGCAEAAVTYTVEEMVRRFATGVREALAA
jgi:glycosyltransferase involved in cell wall biosynthesis